MEKIKQALSFLINEKYAEPHDLMYSNKLPFNLNPYEFNQLKVTKRAELDKEKSFFEKIKLKSFDGYPLFFSRECADLKGLVKIYLDVLDSDLKKSDSYMLIRHMSEILKSRIYSEIDGTLSIESVSSSRKRISDLIKKKESQLKQMILLLKICR